MIPSGIFACRPHTPYSEKSVRAKDLNRSQICACLEELMPRLTAEEWRMAPLTVVLGGRVAIGDEIGQRIGAALVAVLIGERPGLSSPDSLGIYLTWDPRPGRTDAERNCISNIRTEGMSYRIAAHTLHFLMREARARRLTGVALKEDAPLLEPS
jgi:ethanolamine ammonia-lyase small subunit